MSDPTLAWHRHPLIPVFLASALGVGGYLAGRGQALLQGARSAESFVTAVALADTTYTLVPAYALNRQSSFPYYKEHGDHRIVPEFYLEWLPVSVHIQNRHPNEDLVVDQVIVSARELAEVQIGAAEGNYWLAAAGGADKNSYSYQHFLLPDSQGDWDLLTKRASPALCEVPDHLGDPGFGPRPEPRWELDDAWRLEDLQRSRIIVPPGRSDAVDFVIDAGHLPAGTAVAVTFRLAGLIGTDPFNLAITQCRVRPNHLDSDAASLVPIGQFEEVPGTLRFCSVHREERAAAPPPR